MRGLTPLFLLAAALSCNAKTSNNATYLTATAIVTNAHNHSAFECWEFTTPVSVSTDAGTSGSADFVFGNVSEAVYTIIPARFNGGTHNAPAPQ